MVREEEERLLPREPAPPAAPQEPTPEEREANREQEEDEAPYAPLNPRERRSLVFLQMNTPLSVLLCIVAGIFGVMIVPSIDDVFNSHSTLLTPSPKLFFGYLFVLLLFQVGFCMLAVISQNAHTQRCVVQSTGSRLAVENYLLGLWFIFFVLDTPTTRAVGCYVLAGAGLLSLVNFIVLRAKYKPRWVHPFELLLVHVPNKLVTVLVVYNLFWQQLFLDADWVRDPYNGVHRLADALWYTIGVNVVFGILLAVWIGMNSDVTVYCASMYLDAAVLSLRSVPVIGPRSRPFSLVLITFISMGVRTLALVVPGLLKNGCLVICHAHPGGRDAHAVEVQAPPSRAEADLQAAYHDEPQLEGVTVHRPDPTYGSLDQRQSTPSQ